MVKQTKFKLSASTYLIPYDDELYFINLEDDINNNLINISQKDVDYFFNKANYNWDHTNHWKTDKYCIFNVDNEKDILIMKFILEEIQYGIERDWYNYVTQWRETNDIEYKEVLKKGKKEISILNKKLNNL